VHDLSKSDLRHIFSDRDAIDRDRFFILKLHLVPKPGLSLQDAAVQVLLILSGRTMRRLPYETPESRLLTSGHVLSFDPMTNVVEIALPSHLCRSEEELTHLMALVSSAAEYNYCDEYWLDNIDFPKPYAENFRGPRFGVAGIRNLFGKDADSRPLIGVVLKPRVGVPLSHIIDYLREALIGGCDFVSDDLLLVDPAGDYGLQNRVSHVRKLVREVEALTNTKKAYFANVGTSGAKSMALASIAIDTGAAGLVANGFSMGFGSLSELVDATNGRVPIITCNMGAGIITRPRLLNVSGKPTGISETVISKLSRLAGADAVHAGTSASECYGADAWGPAIQALRNPFFGKEPCFAVAEGDLNIANLWDNIRSLGRDVLLEPTSGILAAPGGPRNAATVFRQLAERLSDDMNEADAAKVIEKFAKANRQLGVDKMLDHFGYGKRT
jgi:ribulose 1,5-bisphosphate carboxylase large subunit-like protein